MSDLIAEQLRAETDSAEFCVLLFKATFYQQEQVELVPIRETGIAFFLPLLLSGNFSSFLPRHSVD